MIGNLGLPIIALLVLGPAIAISLVLRRATPIGRTWRMGMSCLVVGVLYAALLMWDDAAEGFCCREYDATVWTELAFYAPLGLVLALLGFIVLAPLEWLAGLLMTRVRR